jgi:Domain of unknown function (DUF1929)/Bacterial Ig domain
MRGLELAVVKRGSQLRVAWLGLATEKDSMQSQSTLKRRNRRVVLASAIVGTQLILLATGVLGRHVRNANAQTTALPRNGAIPAGCVNQGDGHLHCDLSAHRKDDIVNRAPGAEAALIDRANAEGIGQRQQVATQRSAAPKGSPQAAAGISLIAPQLGGAWSAVQDWPAVGIFMSVLPNGKVLAYDSSDAANFDQTRAMTWDPATNATVRADELLGFNIFCSGLAKLLDGALFTAGGTRAPNNQGINKTTTFDPSTNTWTQGATMAVERWYPSVTPLPNGEMLITGGGPDLSEVRATSGSLRALTTGTSQVWANREYPFMATAPNGKAQYLGPADALGQLDTGGTGAYLPTSTRDGKYRSYGSFALFNPKQALIAGGGFRDNSAVVVNLETSSVSTTGAMANQRRQHNLTVLADGSVLATGGYANSDKYLIDVPNAVYAAERWDPATGTWSTLASADRARMYHSGALLLPDGRVLTAGGGLCGDCDVAGYLQRNAEVFSPPYLFAADGSLAPRPVIGNSPNVVGYAGTFGVASPQAASITKVALARLGSVTHSVDMEQRYVPLNFTRTADGVIVDAPVSANIAPPGYYQLLVVDSLGVPSIGKIVRVGAGAVTIAPTGAITSPLNGAALTPGSLTVTVNATDPDGVVSRVEFYDGVTLVASDTTAPYAITYSPSLGGHTITAKIADASGLVTTTSSVTITVSPAVTTTTTMPSTSTTTTSTPNSSTTTTTTTAVPTSTEQIVYADGLAAGYQDWSWAVRNFSSLTPVIGSKAISFVPNGWSGVNIHTASIAQPASSVRFSLHGGSAGGQIVRFYVISGGVQKADALVSTFGGPILANAWRTYELPVPGGLAPDVPVELIWQDYKGTLQSTVSIDDIRLIGSNNPVVTTTVAPTTVAPTTVAPTTTTVAPTTTTVPASTTTTTVPTTTTTTRPTTITTTATTTTTTSTTSTTTVPPTTTTQVPGSFSLVAPATAKVGVAFPLTVSGVLGGGRVDFLVNGSPAGSRQPDSTGRVTLSVSAWTLGTVKVEALWTRFVVGVPDEKALSALVTVT